MAVSRISYLRRRTKRGGTNGRPECSGAVSDRELMGQVETVLRVFGPVCGLASGGAGSNVVRTRCRTRCDLMLLRARSTRQRACGTTSSDESHFLLPAWSRYGEWLDLIPVSQSFS